MAERFECITIVNRFDGRIRRIRLKDLHKYRMEYDILPEKVEEKPVEVVVVEKPKKKRKKRAKKVKKED